MPVPVPMPVPIPADGVFRDNDALDGGVVFVAEGAALVVEGGVYEGNRADNGGGVFHAQEDGHIDVSTT